METIDRTGAFTSEIRDQINRNFASLTSALPLITQGKVFWVRPRLGSNSNDGLTAATAFQTLAKALAACTAGENDIVLFCAEGNTASLTTDYQSSNLDWNKNAVHLIGVNAGNFIGQRSRIAPLATAATFANLFTVSANGCLIANIEFFQGAGLTTLSAAQTCLTVSGQRNHFVNCQISGIGDSTVDYAGSNSLTVTGTENTFDDCYIGLDTVIRSNATNEIIISGTPARTLFRRCQIETYTSLTTFRPVSIATTVDRWVKFIDCDFVAAANITSAATPAAAIAMTTLNGSVIVKNPLMANIGNITPSNNTYCLVLGMNNLAAAHYTGLARTSDIS